MEILGSDEGQLRTVPLAYDFTKRAQTAKSTWRTFAASLGGSVAGVVFMLVAAPILKWLLIDRGFRLLGLAVWLPFFLIIVPGATARGVVRRSVGLPNLSYFPLHQTVVMFLPMASVMGIGLYTLNQNLWRSVGVSVFVAAIYSVRLSGEPPARGVLCGACDVFLEPRLINSYGIDSAPLILTFLDRDEITKIADLDSNPSPNPNENAAKLHIHGCPRCGDGMLSLILTGRLATTEYDAAPVYSQRRTGVVLDQIVPLLDSESHR